MRACLVLLAAIPLFAAEPLQELCRACHSEQVERFSAHPHFARGMSCDACHGPSAAHRKAAGGAAPDRISAPDETPALCGSCHPAARKEFTGSKHGLLVLARSRTRAANCTTCHGVHDLRTATQTEAQCAKCHAAPPARCLVPPARRSAAVSCVNCHAKHTLAAKR
jgi:hypothetical protein